MKNRGPQILSKYSGMLTDQKQQGKGGAGVLEVEWDKLYQPTERGTDQVEAYVQEQERLAGIRPALARLAWSMPPAITSTGTGKAPPLGNPISNIY